MEKTNISISDKWVPEKTYQEAMDMYMGSDSIEKGGW